MDSNRPQPPKPPLDDLAERAARIRAMLARWEAEAVPEEEPEWDIEDVEPMRVRAHDSNR